MALALQVAHDAYVPYHWTVVVFWIVAVAVAVAMLVYAIRKGRRVDRD